MSIWKKTKFTKASGLCSTLVLTQKIYAQPPRLLDVANIGGFKLSNNQKQMSLV